MRIYQNFKEALSEIKRDVSEMGILVRPKTYQDKNVENNPDFETMELQNYIYTVIDPDLKDLKPTKPWADLEWDERLAGIIGTPVNPGKAWLARKELWAEFLQDDGKFSYTYSDRFSREEQVLRVVKQLKEDPDSRQLYISVWDSHDATKLGGISRIPCTLGYLIQFRDGGINLTYLQRSADLINHLVNDIYLAVKLQKYISERSHHPIGKYSHWIGSLHAFRKDLKDVF